jgi:signal transduction histidine kinase
MARRSLRAWLLGGLVAPIGVAAISSVALIAAPPAWSRTLALVALAAEILACATAHAVYRHLTDHLAVVVSAVRQFAGGRFDARLDETGPRETAAFNAAINAVARSVAAHDKQQTEALDEAARQRDRFHAIINAASDGLIFYDARRNVIAANKRCGELLGLTMHDLFHEPTAMLEIDVQARCDAPDTYQARLEAHFAHERTAYQDQLVLLRPRRRVLRRYSCPALNHGQAAGRVFTCTDVTAESDLEQMKSEFVSMASHELRTPLTSIHGALQLALMASGDLLPAEDRELLQISLASTERMVRLVNDLLDLSKIEAGRMLTDRQLLDVRPLVDEATRAMQGMAGPRRIRIVTECPATLPRVAGDHDHLLRVLANLLSNAVKYSPEGAELRVRTDLTPDGVEVTVQDQGPGIPPDQMDKLFKPFCRVGAQERQMTGGTGLGLAISRAIVEQHGGRIRVEPGTPGGSRFIFVLPALAEPAEDQRAVA